MDTMGPPEPLQLSVPTRNIKGLADAQAEDLAKIDISPAGLGLHWQKLGDVDGRFLNTSRTSSLAQVTLILSDAGSETTS